MLVDRHEEIGEITSDDVAVLASIGLRVVIDHFIERKDSTERAITFAAVHRTVADGHKVFFKDRAEAQVLPMVRNAVAESSSPNFTENRIGNEEVRKNRECRKSKKFSSASRLGTYRAPPLLSSGITHGK